MSEATEHILIISCSLILLFNQVHLLLQETEEVNFLCKLTFLIFLNLSLEVL